MSSEDWTRLVDPREDEGRRELISHIRPISILFPLKLFLVTKFKFQNVMSFAIKVNANNERRFDRSTVIFKFGVRIKLHM